MTKYLTDFLKKYYPQKLSNPTLYIKGILDGWDSSRTIIDLYVQANGYKPKTNHEVLPLDIIKHIMPKIACTFLLPGICIYHINDELKTKEFSIDKLKLFNILIDGIINGMKPL